MANVRISKSLGAPDVERCIRPDGSVDGKALRDILRFFLREADMNRRGTFNDINDVNTQVVYLDEIVQSVTVTGEGGTTYIKGGSIETNSVEADIFDADYVYTKNLHIGNIVVDESGNYVSGSGLYADTTGNVVIGGLSGGDGVQTYYQSAAPASPNTGDLWYNTDDWTVRRHNGTTWDIISDITSHGTSANTSNVGSISASAVSGWAHSEDVTAINGGKIHTGSIEATAIASNFTWSKNFIMSTDGKIYTSGKESYIDNDNGIFIGYDTNGTAGYKLYIGNATNHLKWDGTDITINGQKGVLGNDSITLDMDTGIIESSYTTASGVTHSIIFGGAAGVGTNGYIASMSGGSMDSLECTHRANGIQLWNDTESCLLFSCIQGMDIFHTNQEFRFSLNDIDGNSYIEIIKTKGSSGGTADLNNFDLGSTCTVPASTIRNGRAATLIGRVQARSTAGSCTVDQFVGSGVTCDRTSDTAGQYALYLGTGNWIVYLSTGPVSNTLGNHGMVVNPIMNSSGYFANSSTVANVEIQAVGNTNTDQDFHYIAFKIS